MNKKDQDVKQAQVQGQVPIPVLPSDHDDATPWAGKIFGRIVMDGQVTAVMTPNPTTILELDRAYATARVITNHKGVKMRYDGMTMEFDQPTKVKGHLVHLFVYFFSSLTEEELRWLEDKSAVRETDFSGHKITVKDGDA